jgi:hypothetical protein
MIVSVEEHYISTVPSVKTRVSATTGEVGTRKTLSLNILRREVRHYSRFQ